MSGAAFTVWLTGLPGAGKTSLARALELRLAGDGRPACVLDGDELRRGLSSDLGLSPADRSEQARRAAHAAVLLARAGVVAIVALVSPYERDRANAREIHVQAGLSFFEVFVDTPLEICEQRDPKSLYSRARTGRLEGLTGVDAPYEAPGEPDIRLVGAGEDPQRLAERVLASIEG